MNGMTVAHAKRNFEFGVLKGFSIDATDGGWLVVLNQAGYSIPLPLLDARNHEPRVFKTFDAAVSAAESVGFAVKSLRLV